MAENDVVVVGAGPAGLTAAIYTGRARMSTLLLEGMMPGGQVASTDRIENYPGIASTSGSELVQAMVEQARSFGTEIEPQRAVKLEIEDGRLVVATEADRIAARSVIAASGTAYRKLGIPGEEEFRGRGVSYCATCDGPFFKDLEIAVVGGGDSALQETLYLRNFASKIYLIHRRDELRAIKILQEQVWEDDKIECLCETTAERIGGTDTVEYVEILDKDSGESRKLTVAGVFLFVGLDPDTAFLGELVDRDKKGFVITDDAMRTKTKGLLAAGDCRSKLLRQIATAIGDGAMAAFAAQMYLEHGDW